MIAAISFEDVMALLNSPIAIAALAAVVLWALNKLYASKPLWEKYQGTIISAIKFAENAIDDDTENSGLKKLDEALKYVLNVFEEVNNRKATIKEEAELKDAIGLIHDELEAEETL